MIEEKRTQLTGFPDGVDTDTIASQPECSGSWISRQKEALDAYKELSERNLVTTAKKMAVKIEKFLDTHTVVTPVPRANDIHIMDTLKGISQSEVEQDESQSDLLVNYLCHTYSCLRNLKTPDLPSLINDLVIFIKENTYKVAAAVIPLITIVTIIIISKTLIGFEEAGIDNWTIVRNIAYDNNIVIASPTRSPDSTGSRNTRGFNKKNIFVGIATITM
ncbi:uncharacterized protein LOC134687778 [Mytilus trossulus]|uniref:uncharacterized protein LOC134687778 n=1 Tax=Mytilus trossulus TaxID=6551 RepID=UPI00300529E3